MKTSKKRSQEVIKQRKNLVKFFLLLNTVVWLVIGILFVSDMVQAGNTISAAMVAFFFLFNIFILFACAKLLEQKEKWIFFAVLIVTLLNTGLTFTGFPEFLYLLSFGLDILTFFSMLSLKNYFLTQP